MKGQLLRLQQSQTSQLGALMDAMQAGQKELRVEISALSEATRTAASMSGAAAAAPPLAAAANPEELLRQDMEQKDRLRGCIQELVASNSPACVEEAFNALTMMFGNIVKAPIAPRYRRLLISNPMFSKSISPLGGHEKLLSLVGFVLADKTWELKLGSNDEVCAPDVPHIALCT